MIFLIFKVFHSGKGGVIIMEKKRISPAMICHLVLMGILFGLNIAIAIMVLSGNIPGGFAANEENGKVTLILDGIANIFNALALACGFLYLIRGGGKNMAIWYKAFIIQIAIGVALRAVAFALFPGFGAPSIFMIFIVLGLLFLAFFPNLGAQRSMMLFTIILTVEICLAIVIFEPAEALSSIAGSFTRLVLEGTVGIMLHQKFVDKAARKAAKAQEKAE